MSFKEDNDERWKETKFVVEATSFEQFELWREHALGGLLPGQADSLNARGRRVSWEQMNPGSLTTIGVLFDRPICVCVSWARVNGHIIAFYEATSELVDYKMVDAWIRAKCSAKWDRGARRAHCDAMNFHHCLDALAELNVELQKAGAR
jgi:hypothetical protein